MWLIWLIAAGIFFIFEIITTGFLIFWLGIGATLGMICSFFTDNMAIQIGVFVVSSITLIFLTRPIIDKFVTKKTIPTNTYSLIGKLGIVVADINGINSTGQVKLNGEIWSAKSQVDDLIIPKDTEVEVIDIVGVKLVVKPCEQPVKLDSK